MQKKQGPFSQKSFGRAERFAVERAAAVGVIKADDKLIKHDS